MMPPIAPSGVLASGRLSRLMTAFLVLALVLPTEQIGRAAGQLISVIVRKAPGVGDLPERLVESSGGAVGMRLAIIDGFEAQVPAKAVEWLDASPAIKAVTPNAPLKLQSDNYNPGSDLGSMQHTDKVIGATRYWEAGFNGHGVDVAIIDSGVSPVDGLADTGKLLQGPDLSFESQAPNLRHLDTFGHGTFMAGLIAARNGGGDGQDYDGVAPGARIVSIKVADAHGATDVSQVIAAIDWVVQYGHSNGLDIRVLNLSFGTNSSQSYVLDPLAFAAEAAWHAGIFVVVAAGNNSGANGRLMDPAVDPFVVAVGAADSNGTVSVQDDSLLAFSALGDGTRNPDLVAPGRSIQGLRVPGSFIDQTYPTGRISDHFFRGSGTSQAAALISGAAALVIDQRPGIDPDQLKALLTSTAQPLSSADVRGQGAGMIDLRAALRTATPHATQAWAPSTGTGSLEKARGGVHLVSQGVALRGERDIFGRRFRSASMAAAEAAGTSWSGGTWNGSAWTGNEWSGNEWSANEWSGLSWSGNEWSANEWSANEWSANEWSANEWSSDQWLSADWSAAL